MKHLVLIVIVVFYVLIWAQNWTWFAGAIMLRAIFLDRQRLLVDRRRFSSAPATI